MSESIETQVRIAIAKELGWHSIEPHNMLPGVFIGYPPVGAVIGQKEEIPEVTLDVMWNLEECMPLVERLKYVAMVVCIAQNRSFLDPMTTMITPPPPEIYWNVFHAGPELRAEGYLKLKGKWTA